MYAIRSYYARRSGGKANLHLGAVGIGIDLQTGRTIGGTWRGRPVTHHPETNRFLVGIEVTAWDRMMEMARRTARVFPLGYLGVDISIGRDGQPVVLEVNARITSYNVCYTKLLRPALPRSATVSTTTATASLTKGSPSRVPPRA